MFIMSPGLRGLFRWHMFLLDPHWMDAISHWGRNTAMWLDLLLLYANYSLTRDQFFATIVFDYAECQALAAVVVSAEVVGASAKWLGPWRRMMSFVDFLNADNGARHNYCCVSRCAAKNHKWYGRRCFFTPEGSIDEDATSSYRGFLDDMMLWSRELVVSLTASRPEGAKQRNQMGKMVEAYEEVGNHITQPIERTASRRSSA